MKDPEKLALRSEAYTDFLFGMSAPVIQTEYEVLHLMRQCATQFGFNHFMIARMPFGEQQRFSERLVLSSWPAELVRQYDAAGLFHSSALVERLRQTKLPISGEAALLFGEGIAMVQPGMNRIFSITLHTTYGEPFIVTLFGTRCELERQQAADLCLALLQVFETLERTFDAGISVRDRLSAREIECLRWAAAGKSSDEIATILGISVYTVSSYFKTATKKLDSVNRMQAIARAMRLKII
ncbi:helix-turn-helix transcriptional regulator [Pararhizobium antarcticum]|uniref:LuxR family transcriptional regulator n=1 Tax=Pararhizobium antarcticum TaxID=1798805 RepID=A0A657LM71_9HYPH|nr:LuxR family transcriptional regulator [Pararhizobium antarcticum]OJF92252.1 LuxR family transcriptional regulator [Pararhizobium antarcticum]OJF94866.1 LuxR family transcriptional regulator [Rhizobium sp. 58]